MKPIRKAERTRAALRMLLSGPSNTGKTYSALLLARGLVGESGRICVIDSERGRSQAYSDLTDFELIELEPDQDGNVTPAEYISAMHAAEVDGFDAVVIDSVTHEWEACKAEKDRLDRRPGTQNGFMNWGPVTKMHDAFMNRVTLFPAHLILTARADEKFEQQDVGGKKRIVKLGLAIQQRGNFEYEMMVHLALEAETHLYTVRKDNTRLFSTDDSETVSVKTGERLRAWLDGAKPAAPDPEKPSLVKPILDQLAAAKSDTEIDAARSAAKVVQLTRDDKLAIQAAVAAARTRIAVTPAPVTATADPEQDGR